MTDKLRENLGKALECELRELLRTKEAPYMDLAEACQSAARAALAAAPQPTPEPADERAAMAEAMADASESCCYMSDIYRMTDALLVKGFGLRGGAEAGLREALLNIRELNMTATDEDGRRWAQSDLIEQEIVAALAAAPQSAPAPTDERAAMIEVIVQADDAYDRVQGGTWAGSIADALLARGLRLPGDETMTSAARDVLAERQRQINVEGWTPEDDDRYENGDLANAAACYAVHAAEEGAPTDAAPSAWPWDAKWWKPSTPRRDLVKAGALILAEIERLDRAEGDTP